MLKVVLVKVISLEIYFDRIHIWVRKISTERCLMLEKWGPLDMSAIRVEFMQSMCCHSAHNPTYYTRIRYPI